MNDLEFRNHLSQAMPEAPEVFHRAMTDTLDAIVKEERLAQAVKPGANRARSLRRTLLLAALIAILLATAAVAAYHWQIFDGLWAFSGTPKNADTVMQSNIHQETVNNVEITVKEAGYDGRTLYLLYSYRMLDVDTPLGAYRDGVADIGLNEEDLALLASHGVGWWRDNIWFDGKAMGMPQNSGSTTSGSFTPGEILQYEYWRLDNEGVFLDGEVEISLPIGERQPLSEYTFKDHPEKYDENGNPLLPDKGMVTFTLDVSGMLDRVVTEHPNIPTTTDLVTAQVSEACYSPMLTYITLKLEANENALSEYIAENGDGFYDENGNMLWPYGGMDVFGGWVSSLALVDGQGNELFPGTWGNNGYGNDWAEFVYPFIEEPPDELWLAPMADGEADMEHAVRVK